MGRMFMVILMAGCITLLCGQTEEWLWAQSTGGSGWDVGQAITTDATGCVYVTGSFQGTTVFSNTDITSYGAVDVFVVKYDSDGNMLWVRQAGGLGSDEGFGIATDSNGNCYISGYFSDSASFGNTILNSSSGVDNDIFVAKLDASGNWSWAKRAGGQQDNKCMGIDVDLYGNCYITGYFRGLAIFGDFGFISAGNNDIFISKLDPNGNWQWARRAGGTGDDYGYGITSDPNGNVYCSGSFRIHADFGSFTAGGGMDDLFVTKLDSEGNWLWVSSAGGSWNDRCKSITSDANGNCYVTGAVSGNANIGPFYLSGYGNDDVFIAMINTNGNWIWARNAGGSGYDYVEDIDIDEFNNCYITGHFSGTAYFGSDALICQISEDVFLSKLDSAGNWLWAKKTGGAGTDAGHGITLDDDGACYVTGFYYDYAEFGSCVINNYQAYKFFIAKWDDPVHHVGYPNGDEFWLSATNQQVQWEFNCGFDVNIYLSTDNGTNWSLLNSSPVNKSMGSYSLSVPNVCSEQCKIKIVSTQNSQWYDISDYVFTISPYAPLPVVHFLADVISGPQPLLVQFTDSSVAGYGDIISWYWEFGNGDTSAEQNPSYEYQLPGVYSVTLSVLNSGNAFSSLTYTDYITVLPRAPKIELAPSLGIDFGSVYLGSESEVYPLYIQNTGFTDLVIDSMSMDMQNSPFLVVEFSTPLIIAAGDSTIISLVFTPLIAAAVHDSLRIINNSYNLPNCALKLSGIGEYVPLKAPAGLSIDMDANTAALSWNPVSETIYNTPLAPDYYFIFGNSSGDPSGIFYYLGATSGLTYSHFQVGLASERMFYHVRAYKFINRQYDVTRIQAVKEGMSEADVLQILDEYNW